MYGSHDEIGRRRLTAAAVTAAVHAGVIGVLAWGLSFRDSPAAPEDDVQAVTVRLPEPPPPPPPPQQATQAAAAGAPAPEGAKGEAMPREAPRPAIAFPMPPAAVAAGDGSAVDAGAGQQGTGTGAGGTGDGDGGGGSGGVGAPAQRIAGALRDSDYPREAERAGLSGTVGISFRVRSDGSVDRCTVVRSSGAAVLDTLTCRLFTQRFRFRPATDAAGAAIDSTLQTSFTWGIRQRR